MSPSRPIRFGPRPKIGANAARLVGRVATISSIVRSGKTWKA